MNRFSTQNNKDAFVVAFLLLLLVSIAIYSIRTKPPTDQAPTSLKYRDVSLPVDERLDDLLAQMTLEEKVGQMALVEKNSVHDLSDVGRFGLGGILSGAGAKPELNTPIGWHEMTAAFDQASRSSRLGIPVLYGVDANHGHGNVPGATIFPHTIGLGAAGDPGLVERIAAATALELAATGVYWNYSPTLDLPEDIRWGRVYETFGSDPVLAGTLGAAYVRGLQNGDVKVAAAAKHFLGAGSMRFNTSTNPDFKIDQGVTPADEEALHLVYLPVFKKAVDAGVMSVMAGLSSWGDEKISASRHLIQQELKEGLGFEGFVVSDWYGVYEISDNDFSDAVTAINAGVDMVMLPFEYKEFVRNVSFSVRLGVIKEDRINDAVRRILKAKFELGLFDRTNDPDLSVIGSQEHRSLAREAVARSLVLLKDESDLLPLKNGTVRVAGSAAHNVGRQAGAWTVEWQGIDGNWLEGATSILDGMRLAAPNSLIIEYDENGDFPTEGPQADIGIAIVGESPYAEGWGDSERPQLSEQDLATIQKLKASSRHLVVILVTGRPLFITNEIDDWDGVIIAWLPGSEGAGVADVLFGHKPFTGTLPLDWPREISQLPISTDSETADGTPVLFKRGFGLR